MCQVAEIRFVSRQTRLRQNGLQLICQELNLLEICLENAVFRYKDLASLPHTLVASIEVIINLVSKREFYGIPKPRGKKSLRILAVGCITLINVKEHVRVYDNSCAVVTSQSGGE